MKIFDNNYFLLTVSGAFTMTSTHFQLVKKFKIIKANM